MPRRNDIKKILLIGSGPIVIGQACEFDYSGTQACKALREEGYEVVLVNSNPATIMTDPEMADRTYIEPLTWEIVAKVIEAERPDALLPTLGGQTGLNLAMELHQHGVLEKFGVEMIGANAGGDRQGRGPRPVQGGHGADRPGSAPRPDGRQRWTRPGGPCRRSACPAWCGPASPWAAPAPAWPTTARSSTDWCAAGWTSRPIHQVLLEESVLGWKEFEMEVMRDKDDNCVIICSIENFDPMGVHTGDSITVAPAQTLTDKEYQRMRDASIAVMREIGVETGGSNIQFAIHPKTGRMVVIEMNPRVSRSSALASKATGFPIAKIAAKLAVGYRLHELPNDITRETRACFEPTIDYVVTKVPRFAFEKFPEADPKLTTQMKSVGETMAIGRTFKESFQKALRGLEVGSFGFGCDGKDLWGTPEQPTKGEVRSKLVTPNAQRVWFLRYAMKYGMTLGRDPRADGHRPVVSGEPAGDRGDGGASPPHGQPWKAATTPRCAGPSNSAFPTASWPSIWSATEMDVRQERKRRGIVATFKSVDTCAAEFEAYTPYYYSTYEDEDETPPKKPGAAAGDDPRRRTEPHRPGHRVRLLLLPRQLRPARVGHRVDHGQQQPGDRLHRLRHLGPAVLRAADDRRRAEHLRPRRAGRRDRAVRRADAAEPGPGAAATPACRSSAPASTRSRTPRTARSSRTCCIAWG